MIPLRPDCFSRRFTSEGKRPSLGHINRNKEHKKEKSLSQNEIAGSDLMRPY